MYSKLSSFLFHDRSSKGDKELIQLTGLRGLLAFIVFILHTAGYPLPWDWTVNSLPYWPLYGFPHFAMSNFFILSGFVLEHSRCELTQLSCYKSFMWRRFWRIYPVFFFSLILGSQKLCWDSCPDAHLTLVLTPFLLHDFIPHNAYYHIWNPISWSLSVEMFCYSIFPFFSRLFRRLDRVGMTICILCLTAATVLPVVISIKLNDSVWEHDLYIYPIFRLPQFLFGVVAAVFFRRQTFQKAPFLIRQLPSFAIIYLIRMVFWPQTRSDITGLPMSVVYCFWLLFAAYGYRDFFSLFLTFKPLVALGRISYSFYMVHLIFVEYTYSNAYPDRKHAWLVVFILAITVASWSYDLLEIRLYRYMCRRVVWTHCASESHGADGVHSTGGGDSQLALESVKLL